MKAPASRRCSTVERTKGLHGAQSFLRTGRLASCITEAVYLLPVTAAVDYLQLPTQRCKGTTELSPLFNNFRVLH